MKKWPENGYVKMKKNGYVSDYYELKPNKYYKLRWAGNYFFIKDNPNSCQYRLNDNPDVSSFEVVAFFEKELVTKRL